MSPAARKFEHVLNLPTIASNQLVVEHDFNSVSSINSNTLIISHSNKTSSILMKDWMNFTNILGNGIIDKIS